MRKRKAIHIMATLLLLCMLTSFSHQPGKVGEAILFEPDEDQTWFGDFIVESNETVIIENSNFTVMNGRIFVYGNLAILNSTLRIMSNSYFKNIRVYGNFTAVNSTIPGRISMRAYEHSRLVLDKSNTNLGITTTNKTTTIHVSNSSFKDLNWQGTGQCDILGSNASSYVAFYSWFSGSLSITNSSIERMTLDDPAPNVELRPGLVPNLTFSDTEESSTLVVLNSYVNKWEVYVEKKPITISNSTVEFLQFFVQNTSETSRLTLNAGFIEHKNIHVEKPGFEDVNITITNSTIEGGVISIGGGAVEIFNSSFGVAYWTNRNKKPLVTIINSTIPAICSQGSYDMMTGARLTVLDSIVEVFVLEFLTGSLNLVLRPGYFERLDILDLGKSTNVTVIRTQVGNWSVHARSCTVSICNSTLAESCQRWGMGNLFPSICAESSEFYVRNSTVPCAGFRFSSSFDVANSTIGELYLCDGSNVKSLDSTIGTIITDPVSIELINTILFSELDLSIALQEDVISTQAQDTHEVPLPEGIQPISKYLHISTAYEDILSAQVKIYYDENKLEEYYLNETDLAMYSLDKRSNTWGKCLIQGTNATSNNVWSNVTDLNDFSFFVIAYSLINHNIAVTNLMPRKAVVGQGYNLPINITIQNRGDFEEEVDITAYANTTLIATQRLVVPSGSFSVFSSTWNTTGFTYGDYTVWVYVLPVPGETFLIDNTYTDGNVTVTISGDVNGDREVDSLDLVILKEAYGSTYVSSNWNANCDINGDNKIDSLDLFIHGKNYGRAF